MGKNFIFIAVAILTLIRKKATLRTKPVMVKLSGKNNE